MQYIVRDKYERQRQQRGFLQNPSLDIFQKKTNLSNMRVPSNDIRSVFVSFESKTIRIDEDDHTTVSSSSESYSSSVSVSMPSLSVSVS